MFVHREKGPACGDDLGHCAPIAPVKNSPFDRIKKTDLMRNDNGPDKSSLREWRAGYEKGGEEE